MVVKMVSLSACGELDYLLSDARGRHLSIPSVMLFYDIMLTFADEVEFIWSRRFSFVSVLWYLVSFLTLRSII